MLKLAAALLMFAAPLWAETSPLPSWNDTPTKTAILDFVAATVDPASATFVPVADRVAVFDNDGTLWSEQPLYFQFLFALDRAHALAAADPAWANTPILQAAASGDMKTIMAGGEKALLEIVSATHSGMSVEQFTTEVATWIATAKHPTTGMLYTQMTYQPMLDLLDYLRANDFQTYIVSGGGVDFMRAFTETAYGIPTQNVIGSLGKATFQIVDGQPQVMKDPGIGFIDDKDGKPIGIERNIGKRQNFAAGNSDGDQAMLQWTTAGAGSRMGILIHHTDAEREFAYDRDSHIGKLDTALDAAPAEGWVVVDMKADWAKVWSGK